MLQTKKLVSNKGTLEVEVERHGAGVVIRTIDKMKHTQKSISVFDELIPGLIARLSAIAATRSPTLRAAVQSEQGRAASAANKIQCPKCAYWVDLYEGNKIALHVDYSRPGKPYCELSNVIYTPTPNRSAGG